MSDLSENFNKEIRNIKMEKLKKTYKANANKLHVKECWY